MQPDAESKRADVNLLKNIAVVFDRIVDLLVYVTIGLLIFAWLSVCLEIVMRYFLNRPLVWVIEISEYILLFITFLGATWLLKKEGHVAIDVVLTKLDPRTAAIVNIVTSLLGAASCLALAWYAGQTTWVHFQKGIYDQRTLELPMAPLMAVIPIGSFLLFVQFLRRTYGYILQVGNGAR